jgi:hypothetical protein
VINYFCVQENSRDVMGIALKLDTNAKLEDRLKEVTECHELVFVPGQDNNARFQYNIHGYDRRHKKPEYVRILAQPDGIIKVTKKPQNLTIYITEITKEEAMQKRKSTRDWKSLHNVSKPFKLLEEKRAR